MANLSHKRKLKTIKASRVCSKPKFGDDDVEEVDFSSLREDYKANRRRFVHEYIKDFNGTAAMMRYGCGAPRTAQVRASQWLDQPYTQFILAQVMAEMDEGAIVSRNEILFGLKREANQKNSIHANSSTRTTAWRALGKIKGMEVTKVEGSVTVNGGVMAVPLASPEAWKEAAGKMQKKLKDDVRK